MDADIISGMKGTDPNHVHSQLCCMPGNGYHVDAASFANIMERHTYPEDGVD